MPDMNERLIEAASTPWPTHADGTNKRMGDMTGAERAAQMQAARARFAAKAA